MDFSEKIEQAEKRIPTMEHMLGSGLQQPYNNTNSGQRKLMHKTHRDHIFPIKNGEKAINETGYEIRYGDLSSSITVADADYKIITKISKFSFSPNHHYWLLLVDEKKRHLDVIERTSYHHITESYGYLYNNSYLDTLQTGDSIPEGTIAQKSLAFDEYMNRKDGINFNVLYLSLDQNMEDSVIFSDVAAERSEGSLLKPISIPINENDIALDIYGKNGIYKCMPDIGEDVVDGILIALRKEKNDEALFNQSVDHLKRFTMSDKKYTIPGNGKVIDVDIYCNNIDNLDEFHNAQFKMYYNELQRYSTEIVQNILPYVSDGYSLSYELQKLYANAKRVVNKDPYMSKKKEFSNLIIEIMVLEDKSLEDGDKTSNRFGGKGIVSKIIPQKLMPMTSDGEYVDVILNSYTMPNRENPGQNFEQEINFIGRQIIKKIEKGECSNIDEAMDLIYRFLHHVSPVEEQELRELCDLSYDPEGQKRFYIETIIQSGGCIDVSAKPITESFDIDRLDALYREFPWVEPLEVIVPITGSDGNIRYIPARRKLIVGKEYMFRLKQYAEEKFSANSLSATNIRNENTKSKANRNFTEFYKSTPIRFGNMELNDESHLGIEVVVQNMMIHSVSPHARRLTAEMYVCDPFDIDIKLDADSSNRSAEIVNTYLKTIGRKLVFKKIKKNFKKPITFSPIRFQSAQIKRAIYFNTEEDFDAEKHYKEHQALIERKKANPNKKNVLYFKGIDLKNRNK